MNTQAELSPYKYNAIVIGDGVPKGGQSPTAGQTARWDAVIDDRGRWGRMIKDNEDYTEYANGIVVTKQPMIILLTGGPARVVQACEGASPMQNSSAPLGILPRRAAETVLERLMVPSAFTEVLPSDSPPLIACTRAAPVPRESTKWLNYYLNSPSSLIAGRTDELREIYQRARTRTLPECFAHHLRAAIREDFETEGCDIGPVFSAALCDLRGRSHLPHDLPADWFFEAGVRDQLCTMGINSDPPRRECE